jgi:hypothetical protein
MLALFGARGVAATHELAAPAPDGSSQSVDAFPVLEAGSGLGGWRRGRGQDGRDQFDLEHHCAATEVGIYVEVLRIDSPGPPMERFSSWALLELPVNGKRPVMSHRTLVLNY